jgi:hypothetical protein
MRAALPTLAVVLVTGCASGGPPPRSHAAPELFRLATVGSAADPPPIVGAGGPETVATISLEVRLETSGGQTVVAPRLVVLSGLRANVQVLQQTSYIANFAVERKDGAALVDPVVALAEDGVRIELVPRAEPGEGGSTTLAYEVKRSRVHRPFDQHRFADLQGNPLTIQLPTFDRTEASGVRDLAPGVWGLLARLPDGAGGTVAVLARASTLRGNPMPDGPRDGEEFLGLEKASGGGSGTPAAAPESRGDDDSLPARAAKAALPAAPPGRLDLRAILLRTDLPAGSVVEEEAAAEALAGAEPLGSGHLQLVTGLVPGARVACLLDEAFVKDYDIQNYSATFEPILGNHRSGLTAQVGEDGALRLSWTTTPKWERFEWSPNHDGNLLAIEIPGSETQEARVVPSAGTRLVVVARLADGRAAGVLVRFRPEEEPGPAAR